MIRLENGLEALLCSDPTTDKAAAALNVRVGHLSDPVRSDTYSSIKSLLMIANAQVELQGLAHFWYASFSCFL